jgi:hypothetical protein
MSFQFGVVAHRNTPDIEELGLTEWFEYQAPNTPVRWYVHS